MTNIHSLEYLERGDRVIMDMSDERRSYSAGATSPNGTAGTVVGFYRYREHMGLTGHHLPRVKPGIYEQNGVPYIDWEDGFRSRGGTSVGPESFHFADPELFAARSIERMNHERVHGFFSWMEMRQERLWLADLPKTKFHPGDVVRDIDPSRSHSDVSYLKIATVDYSWKERHVSHHFEQTMYDISAYGADHRHMYRTTLWDEDLELVRRGSIWAHYEGVPYEYRDVREEASTAYALGRFEELRNPANGIYRWSEDEWKAGLIDGSIDAISLDANMAAAMRISPLVSAHRFTDRDLGARMRKETLKGFGLDDSTVRAA